jgi:hypothetical protein
MKISRMKKILSATGRVLGVVSCVMAAGAPALAGVQCKHSTEDSVPYVSVSGGGSYQRVYFHSYSQRDAAESKCLSLHLNCSSTVVRVSNGDADGLGQHYNTYSELERFIHGFSSSHFSSSDRCLRSLVSHVVDLLEEMPGNRSAPGSTRSVGWGRLPNGELNPLSPINKL